MSSWTKFNCISLSEQHRLEELENFLKTTKLWGKDREGSGYIVYENIWVTKNKQLYMVPSPEKELHYQWPWQRSHIHRWLFNGKDKIWVGNIKSTGYWVWGISIPPCQSLWICPLPFKTQSIKIYKTMHSLPNPLKQVTVCSSPCSPAQRTKNFKAPALKVQEWWCL